MVTIRDVAKQAGVSVATVSRVINDGDVKEDTYNHVLKVIEELNYRPNQIARGLSKKRTNTVALIIPALTNPFFPSIASAIENIALQHGYKVFLYNSENNQEKLLKYMDTLASNYIDGVIVDSHVLNENNVELIKRKEMPIVIFDRTNYEHGFTSVSVNNRIGGRMATKHLLERGCTYIGHISGPEDVITGRDRLLGYRKVVEKFDWFDETWIYQGNFSVEGGYTAMKNLIDRHDNIQGVFAANDLSAIGAMKAAFEMSKKVPDDLAIIGFDGIDMADYIIPSLTTIVQPIEQMGKFIMEELLYLINNPDGETKQIEFDTKLKIQEST